MAFTPLSIYWEVVFFLLYQVTMGIEIQVNGRREQIEECTIAALVSDKQLTASSLIVEYNRAIIKQDAWTDVTLQEGDVLELLNFVGGG